MQTTQSVILNYFQDLKYEIITQNEAAYIVKQKRTGLTVELDFSFLGGTNLPKTSAFEADKKLIIIDVQDIESIGFTALEAFAEEMNPHYSLVVYEEEFFEQTMKEIWMFLSVDPRDRDVFNESRFYKS
jgi:hypothetical protein